jgi:hypothetical protein
VLVVAGVIVLLIVMQTGYDDGPAKAAEAKRKGEVGYEDVSASAFRVRVRFLYAGELPAWEFGGGGGGGVGGPCGSGGGAGGGACPGGTGASSKSKKGKRGKTGAGGKGGGKESAEEEEEEEVQLLKEPRHRLKLARQVCLCVCMGVCIII